MNDKKLSEALLAHAREAEAFGDSVDAAQFADMSEAARALEERVESLKSALEAADPLNAAADRLGRVNDQKRFQLDLAAATARVAELEGQLKEAGSMVIAATNRDHTATARAEAAEKECTELREIAAQRCTQAEAAERKLADCEAMFETTDRAYREASDRMEHAEAEVARLRDAYGTWGDAAEHIESEREALFVENRALRAKLEKVRAHVEQRQKLLEVGGTKEPPEMAAEFDARYAELDMTLDILDGEGGDE